MLGLANKTSLDEKFISAEEIVRKFRIPYSTVNHYTNLGFFKVVCKKQNKRLYKRFDIKRQVRRIARLKREGYPLRLIRKKLVS